MIGTVGGAVLAVIGLGFAAVLGIRVGRLTGFGFHQSWGLKVALQDGAIAILLFVAATFGAAIIEGPKGDWDARTILIFAVALGSVVLKHLAQFALRSAN